MSARNRFTRHRYRLRRLLGGVLLAGVLLSGCAGGLVQQSQPARPAPTTGAMEADERWLLDQAGEMERQLRSRGLVLEDPELQAYVDSVGRKLVPSDPAGVSYRFAILRDPAVNAFALPTGAIFVHAGLLAHIENEAQLAQVLAHELMHTAHRHQLAGLRDLKSKTVAAKLTDLLFAGMASPVVGLTYAASVSGYGREQEQEADREGLRVIVKAGYRPEEAVRVFEAIDTGPQVTELERYFYSDHPANAERANALRALLASWSYPVGTGRTEVETYRKATRKAVLETIQLCLANRLYGEARKGVDRHIGRSGEDAWLVYYAGEAHRLAAQDPEGAAREIASQRRQLLGEHDIEAQRANAAAERQAALERYRRALALDPTLALAHRGIGLVSRETGDRATARTELGVYLAGAGSPSDRYAIEKILNEVNQ